ncbi:MAG: hypothetical protein ACOYXT_13660 [Bacteroidota bacterium]
MFKILAVLFLWLLVANAVYAQVDIVEIDSTTRLPNKTLPFDQPFILKIPTKADYITGFTFVQHIGKRDLASTLRFRERFHMDYKLHEFDESAYAIKTIDKKKYLFVSFAGENLLNPGKHYSIFWVEDKLEAVMQIFDHYHDYRLRNPTTLNIKDTSFVAAWKIYKRLIAVNKNTLSVEVGFVSSDSTDLKTIQRFYDDKSLDIPAKYQALGAKVAAFEAKVTTLSTQTALNANNGLLKLIEDIITPNDHLDSELKGGYLTSVPKSSQRLSKLFGLSQADYQQVVQGLADMDCNLCTPNTKSDYARRKTALSNSLAAIDQLYVLSAAAEQSDNALNPGTRALKTFRDELAALDKDMGEIVKAWSAIKTAVASVGLAPIDKLDASTNINSFDTRTKLSIAPDFGVVTTRIGRDGANPYDVVPYLGFHINFRPINRDVKFWSYRHNTWHYLSFMVGWSLVNIGNGPTAGKDSVSSYFAKEKGTLLTGVGIRLGNALKLTVGEMLYFKYSESASNPGVYTDRKLRSWPFVGISIDLSLKDLLNGLSDTFSGAPKAFTPTSPPTPN